MDNTTKQCHSNRREYLRWSVINSEFSSMVPGDAQAVFIVVRWANSWSNEGRNWECKEIKVVCSSEITK